MPIFRYSELLPDQLELIWSENPLAIWPIGALEWHGPHLPLGLDGIVAEDFCEDLAQRSGGVLLPACWLPMTTLPHRYSQQVRTEAFRMIVEDQIEGLLSAGVSVVCIITGHYAQGHEIVLYECARAAMERYDNVSVIAASPLEVLKIEEVLDHAARWETAQLMAIRPDLVHLDRLPSTISPKSCAVLGEEPEMASVDEGAEIIENALRTWMSMIRLATLGERSELLAFYGERTAAYQEYVERFYKGNWEEALSAWWETQV